MKRPGEVAAIDTRHIERDQRLQCACVVPIVEMATIAIEPFERGESLVRAVEHLARGEVAEIGRRQIRQQGHSDICRRRARGDRGHRNLLKIVGWQPVFLRVHHHLEVAPRLPG